MKPWNLNGYEFTSRARSALKLAVDWLVRVSLAAGRAASFSFTLSVNECDL